MKQDVVLMVLNACYLRSNYVVLAYMGYGLAY